VLGLAVLTAALATGRMRGAAWSASHPADPALTVLPAPTPSAPAPLQPTPAAPTATPEPTQPSPPLRRGALVEVAGTGGDGLRIREQPGLNAPVKFLGLESEVFQLLDGPVEQDGFSWWLLENPYDAAKFGWAVGSFLRPLGP
jgi:hypothetical protein